MLVFTDLETTGLNADDHSVLEVAAIVTDDALVEVARFHRVAYWAPAGLMLRATAAHNAAVHRVDPFVLKMHTDNGLWLESSDRARTDGYRSVVENDLAALIAQHCPQVGEKTGPQLAGNTISFDRTFLARYFPKVHCLLHYRNLDCSTLNEMARRFWPSVYVARPKPEGAAHRAMADVQESLVLARYYATHLGPVTP